MHPTKNNNSKNTFNCRVLTTFIIIFILLFSVFATAQKHAKVIKKAGVLPAGQVDFSVLDFAETGTEELVELNLSPLSSNLLKHKKISIWLGDELGTVVVRKTKVTKDINGVTTWHGKVKKNKGSVLLSFKKNKLAGSAFINDQVYRIKRMKKQNQYVVYKEDTVGLAQTVSCPGGIDPGATPSSDETHVHDRSVNPSSNTQIDILIVYSNGIAAYYDEDVTIANLIAETNTAYADSNVNITLRLVGSQKFPYPDTSNLSSALSTLRSGTGNFAGVKALRDQKGADLVAFIQRYVGGPYAGIGYLMSYNSTGFAGSAYSVTVLPSTYTFAHELGHNMGLHHNIGSSGVFSYSVGYRFPPGDNTYRTIMSYSPGMRVGRFSNPDRNYSGHATGAANADSARSLNITRTTVADFRPPNQTPAVISVTPDGASGKSKTFTSIGRDMDGATDIQSLEFLVNTSITAANSVYVMYRRDLNIVYLRNDANTSWTHGKLGSSTVLSNSQCSINLASVTRVASGVNLTMNLPVTFKSAFAGTKKIYIQAKDSIGQRSGWRHKSTFEILANSKPTATSITPSSGSGHTQTFVAKYSDADGVTNLKSGELLINDDINGANSVYLFYRRDLNRLYLKNDANSSWMAGVPGGGGSLSNSQGTINLSSVTVQTSGNDLTLSVPVQFKSSFVGGKYLFMKACDFDGHSGWKNKGSFTVTSSNTLPAVISVSPSTGSGSSRTFAATYRDLNGVNDLKVGEMIINTSLSGANAVWFYYRADTNIMYLRNNANTGWTSGRVGSGTILSNGQCTIRLANVSVSKSGVNMVVNFPIQFKGAFAGAKKIYIQARDKVGNRSGWRQKATFTVTGS